MLENRTNFKDIFTITNKLLARNDPSSLPPSEDPARLAQEFSDYFQEKINSIMLQLKPTSDCSIDNRYIEDGFLTQYHMHKFHEVREEEVLKLLTTSPAKSCELDPFPSKLLVRHCLEVAPIITQIVNASLTCGEFTSELKMHFYIPYLRNLESTASVGTTDQYPTYLFCPNLSKEWCSIKLLNIKEPLEWPKNFNEHTEPSIPQKQQ